MFGDEFTADMLDLLRYQEFGTAVLVVVPPIYVFALLAGLLLKDGARAIFIVNIAIAAALIFVILTALDFANGSIGANTRNIVLVLSAVFEAGVFAAGIAALCRAKTMQKFSWVAFFAHGGILIPLAIIVGLLAGHSIF